MVAPTLLFATPAVFLSKMAINFKTICELQPISLMDKLSKTETRWFGLISCKIE